MNSTQFLADLRGPDTNSDEPLPEIAFDHIDHCINAIRESLMCSADITPNVFLWDDRVERVVPAFDVVHECKDFESVKEWAVEHHFAGKFNNSIHVIESSQESQ